MQARMRRRRASTEGGFVLITVMLVLVVMALPERERSEADEDVDRPDAIDVDAAIVGEAP